MNGEAPWMQAGAALRPSRLHYSVFFRNLSCYGHDFRHADTVFNNNSFLAKIIAFITNHQEIKKILKHIGEENERALPLPAIMRYELEDSCDWEDFPSDETNFCNGEWGP